MKYDLTTPCSSCPFRSDVRPFISAERAEDILTNGLPFSCHKTLDYDVEIDSEDEDADGSRQTEKTRHCAGVLIILEKEKRPHLAMRLGEHLGLYDPKAMKLDGPGYAGVEACVEAHRKENN